MKPVGILGISVCFVFAVGCGEATGQRCGDGVATGDEACDGFDLRGNSCSSVGAMPGLLRCNAYCSFDTDGCGAGACGDGVWQTGEQCDGADFGGSSCATYGFNSGTLACGADCFVDTSGCVGCGDGVLDPATEDCDGDELGSQTCVDQGFHTGVIACSEQCTFDITDCERGGYCGDDEVQVMYENCEPWAMTHTCRDLDFWGGDLQCPDCEFVTHQCFGLESLSMGGDHACGLDTNGHAWCWGHGGEGQLGHGVFNASWEPVEVLVPGGVAFTQIAAGGDHTCALDSLGRGWCWGDGEDGQVGNGETGYIWSAPQLVTMPAGVTFTSISTGFMNSCALDTDGDAWCWGYGNSGSIGNGLTDDVSVPTAVSMPPSTQFVSIDVGSSWVCALDTVGVPWCWGSQAYGCGSPMLQPMSYTLPAGTAFAQIAVGGEHTCALDQLGSAWCWGRDNWGQIGNGSDSGSCLPTAVSMPGQTFVSMGSGSQHACGISTCRDAPRLAANRPGNSTRA